MRTIKFRGKVQGYNTWVYGSLVQDKEGNCIIISTPECAIEPTPRILVDADTVGQFTGLLDINGKEIYEGDIIYREGKEYQIIYSDMDAQYLADEVDGYDRVAINNYAIDFDKIEVIGNIHDNQNY